MLYLYYDNTDKQFLLWEMRTNPPYEACITTKQSAMGKYNYWSKHLFTRDEKLKVNNTTIANCDEHWSDAYPSISLLLTFNTLEDYFTWADQDHPELFV